MFVVVGRSVYSLSELLRLWPAKNVQTCGTGCELGEVGKVLMVQTGEGSLRCMTGRMHGTETGGTR